MIAEAVRGAGAFSPVLGYGLALMVLDRAQLRARLSDFVAAGGADWDSVERLADAVQSGANSEQMKKTTKR